MTEAAEQDTKLEKERPKWDRRGQHLRFLNAWSHRCFLMKAKKFNGHPAWWCTNGFPAFMTEVPHTFYWMARDDRDGLKTYIDALLLGQRSKSIEYEKNGLVEGIEMFTLDRPEETRIHVGIRRFIDTLTLRDNLELPLWGKITFITDGNRLVPTEYLAAISQLMDPETRKLFDVNRPWRGATVQDLASMGLRPEDVTSSMYRYRDAEMTEAYGGVEAAPEMVAEPVYEGGTPEGDDPPTAHTVAVPSAAHTPDPSPQAREVEVRRNRYERHFEVVTIVEPPRRRGRVYYVRRLATLREGRMIWVGTSFFADGPWKVWQRETATLLALGLPD